MLEECEEFSDIETIFSQKVKLVSLLGEIPLTDSDINSLSELIRLTLANGLAAGLRLLKTKYPTCLALFLIGMGRYYDKERGYWPIVANHIGLLDAQWQAALGAFFTTFLQQHNLPKFEEEVGLANLTPILAHACLPDACLDEYFERILLPLVRREPTRQLAIETARHDLVYRRRQAAERNTRFRELSALNDSHDQSQILLENAEHEQELLQAVGDLLKTETELESRRSLITDLESGEQLLVDLADQRAVAQSNLDRHAESIRTLSSEPISSDPHFQRLHGEVDRFNQLEENLRQARQAAYDARRKETEYLAHVVDCWKILSLEPWQDDFLPLILAFPLDVFHRQLDEYWRQRTFIDAIQSRIDDLLHYYRGLRRPVLFLHGWISRFWKVLFHQSSTVDISTSQDIYYLQALAVKADAEMRRHHYSITQLMIDLPIEALRLVVPASNLTDYFDRLVNAASALDHTHLAYLTSNSKVADLEKELRNGMVPYGFAGEEPIDALLVKFHNSIEDMIAQQETTTRAREIYISKAQARQRALAHTLAAIQCQITDLEHDLTEKAGTKPDRELLIRAFHEDEATLAKTRRNLADNYPGFQAAADQIHRLGMEVVVTRQTAIIARYHREADDSATEARRKKLNLDDIPEIFQGIDEPIRRFLLYGDKASEDIHLRIVALFVDAVEGKDLEDPVLSDHPDRYLIHFRAWWRLHQAALRIRNTHGEERDRESGKWLREPFLRLDPIAGEINAFFPPQRFPRPEGEGPVRLFVNAPGCTAPIFEKRLSAYSRRAGLVETDSIDPLPLLDPAPEYTFQLFFGTALVRSWTLPGLNPVLPCLAFSCESYRRYPETRVPAAPVFLVLPSDCHITPLECILAENGRLFGAWSGYAHYEVDLSSLEAMTITPSDGEPFFFHTSIDLADSIHLEGGNPIVGMESGAGLVYSSPPQTLHLPTLDSDRLSDLHLAILVEDEDRILASVNFQGQELEPFLQTLHNGTLYLALNTSDLLKTATAGYYTLHLLIPSLLDWRCNFCLVPGLDLAFDQRLYPPRTSITPPISAKLRLPSDTTFQPTKPAEVAARDGSVLIIQIPPSENVLAGQLHALGPENRKITLSLSCAIPKIRYRFQGLPSPTGHWQDDYHQECWLGDWAQASELFLILDCAILRSDGVSLRLVRQEREISTGQVQDRFVRFDLKALEDALRRGTTLETISLIQSRNPGLPREFPLFTVRTRWQAEKIKCYYHPEADDVAIDVAWIESGRACEKVVRLWRRLEDSRPKMICEQRVAAADNHVTIRIDAHEVDDGNYLVHILPYEGNRWAPAPVCPRPDQPNTALIQIVTRSHEKAVSIQKVMVDETHWYKLPSGSYRIRILGKVIHQAISADAPDQDFSQIHLYSRNENWYVGCLEVNGFPVIKDHLAGTNPVRFEYDTKTQIITSIEDSDGDGAEYCYDCNMLFWDQLTVEAEKQLHHKNYAPIGFRVQWETE